MASESTLTILRLILEVFKLIKDLEGLLKRVLAGDEVTDEEIKKARQDIKDAVQSWNE